MTNLLKLCYPYCMRLLFCSELFPTSIRTSAIGTCSIVSRLFTMAAPFVSSYLPSKFIDVVHPPLFLAVRRSSHFCEMVVNFYAVLSKRGRFSKAPSLKTSCFPYRGPRVSTIGVLFGLLCFEFLFGEVNQPIYCGT